MALCKICRTIPFHEFATLPSFHHKQRPILESPGVDCITIFSSDNDAPGIPWHESLDALKDAANNACPICRLGQQAAEAWLADHYKALAEGPLSEYKEVLQLITRSENQLRLNRRESGQAGFTILMRNSLHETAFDVVGAVNFTLKRHDPRRPNFATSPNTESGSVQSLNLADQWVRDCMKWHDDCKKTVGPLPSRILDVGLSGDIIKLIKTVPGDYGAYAALSYCWGDPSLNFTTASDTYQARLSGFSLEIMPKTLQDAVVLTRHMNIRYLWLDSLCIIQNDKDDWAREAGLMMQVYAEAYVVIAADRSHNCREGLFHNREGLRCLAFHMPRVGEIHAQVLNLRDEILLHDEALLDEPLSKRGWALQERILAPRVLHYGGRQMYFECNRGIVGETGCNAKVRYCHLNFLQQEPSWVWHKMIDSFTNRNLTNITDRLPAVAGLASLMNSQVASHYVAGLWSVNMIDGLLWRSVQDPAHGSTNSLTKYTGPTWSWAGYKGRVEMNDCPDIKPVAKIESWDVVLVSESNTFGELKHAWIRVNGPTASVQILENTDQKDVLSGKFKYVSDEDSSDDDNDHGDTDDTFLNILWDKPDEVRSLSCHQWDAQLLLLARKTYGSYHSSASKIEQGEGILLIAAENGHGKEVKRVGSVLLSQHQATRFMKKSSCKSFIII